MKKLLILIGAIAAYGQTVSLSDTLTNAVGGGSFTGRITVTLNAPGSAQPLYYSTTSLTGWQAVYCLGVTGSDCTATTAAGVFAATLYANSTITPAGTSYSARFTPAKGSPWSETWVVGVGDTKLYQIRSTSTPTPTQLFSPSLISLTAGSLLYGSSNGTATSLTAGTNGHVLTLSGGYPAWSAVAACSTCVVTSGSYADPAWITSLAGSKVSGNISGNAGTATSLAANGTNCAAGTFPLGVDASGSSESCTALPTTISGTANQITASASTGAVTLSLPATITGLTSVTSTGFTGALTGNASTATALASTVASGRLWIGQGTGVPTSDSTLVWDSGLSRLGLRTISDPSANTSANLNIFPSGTATQAGITVYNNSAGGSAQYAQFYIVGPGSSSEARLMTGANTGTAGDITFLPNGTERMRIFRATGNVAVGTAVEYGYGLHAANRGTNGNLLVFDPTATTGTTKAVFKEGAGQSTTASTEWQDSAGTFTARVQAGGGFQSKVAYSVIDSGATVNHIGLYTTGLSIASGKLIAFSATTEATATKDLSLSRASAGVLQVGDGGANANGSIVSASFLGATGAGGTVVIKNTSGNANYAGITAGRGVSADNGGIDFYSPGASTATLRARIAGTTGNVIIGSDVDSNFKLDIASSGSSGTLRVYDQTATTGNTKEVIRAGAGQSTNLTEWQNNAGTVISRVANTGEFLAPNGTSSVPGLSFTGSTTTGMYWDGTYLNLSVTGSRVMYIRNGDIGLPSVAVLGNTQVSGATDGNLLLKNNAGTAFTCLQLGGTTSSFPCLKRSAAILQARLADDTAYTDMQFNAVIVSKAAPSASSDACTAGQLWAGDMGGTKYAFYCVASGTIVRSAFASF